MKKVLSIALTFVIFQLNAQTSVGALYKRYRALDQYKLDITYTFENAAMGFSNTQQGQLVLQGDRYRLNYGNTELWVSDGKTEYIGTKEEDHSQILYFCAGENEEAVLDFTQFLTSYGKDHKLVGNQGNTFQLELTGETIYLQAFIETNGTEISQIKLVDDMNSTYTFKISGFTTNTSGTSFTINENDYREKIDERRGCN